MAPCLNNWGHECVMAEGASRLLRKCLLHFNESRTLYDKLLVKWVSHNARKTGRSRVFSFDDREQSSQTLKLSQRNSSCLYSYIHLVITLRRAENVQT
jgi:hypothetical protein